MDLKKFEMADGPTARRNKSFHYVRFIIIIAGGVATGLMMFLRLSITVAIVSMVNHTQLYLNEHPNATQDDFDEFFGPNYFEVGEFDWSNEVQAKIMTYYMITYTLFQVPITGFMIEHGLRLGVVISLSLCALTNILTPIMSYWSWYWVVALRMLNGCAASGIMSGMVSLIEKWSPISGTADGVVLYQFTSNIIVVAAPVVGGLLASVHWKWVFYVPGVVTLVFCLLWYILIADKPENSRIISQKELDLIKGVAGDKKTEKESKPPQPRGGTPYGKILRVKEFYSLAIIWCLYCGVSGSLNYLLPNYLHRVLMVPVEEIGYMTSIAQAGSLFSMLWPNRVADILMNSRLKLGLTSARRVVAFIATFMASSALLLLAYNHSNTVVLFAFHRFFQMTHNTVFLATVMSQFGPHGLSGPVYSILNSLGCINSAVVCVIVGKFLDYTGETLACWSWVYVAMVSMNVVYFLIYSVFCHSRPVALETKSVEVSGS